MTENFVDVVGYQFERVHTGVIGWLLDTERGPLDKQTIVRLFAEMTSDRFRLPENVQVTAKHEYPIGGRRKVDLVLEAEATGQPTRYVVIECKTDSDVSKKQLDDTRKHFEGKPASLVVLTLGASQFTYQHIRDDSKHWEFMSTQQAIDLFGGLPIAGKSRVFDDWIHALKDEQQRIADIDLIVGDVKHEWASELKDKGYRLDFPVWYLCYAKLREHLERGPHKNWAIRSGGHNPVLNWWGYEGDDDRGWIVRYVLGKYLGVYWEFNRASFRLKAGQKDGLVEGWADLREQLLGLCEGCSVRSGNRTARRKGAYASLYAWDFDFPKDFERDALPDTASQVNAIIADLHPKLEAFLDSQPNISRGETPK